MISPRSGCIHSAYYVFAQIQGVPACSITDGAGTRIAVGSREIETLAARGDRRAGARRRRHRPGAGAGVRYPVRGGARDRPSAAAGPDPFLFPFGPWGRTEERN